MSIHYLIDGYNLIETHRDSFPGSLSCARQKLIDRIIAARPQGSIRNRITIFFDGQPGISSPNISGLDVRFTRGRDADWYIKSFVNKHPNPKQLVVVTDDKSIIKETVSSGAKAMSTEDFRKKLSVSANRIETSEKPVFSKEELKEINDLFLGKDR